MDFSKKQYNLPKTKISALDVINWMYEEFSDEEVTDIIIEILSRGDCVWDTVSKYVSDTLET